MTVNFIHQIGHKYYFNLTLSGYECPSGTVVTPSSATEDAASSLLFAHDIFESGWHPSTWNLLANESYARRTNGSACSLYGDGSPPSPSPPPHRFNDSNIVGAVQQYSADKVATIATYGAINGWERTCHICFYLIRIPSTTTYRIGTPLASRT